MCCRGDLCCVINDLRLATIVVAVLSLLGDVGVLAFVAVRDTKQAEMVLLSLLNYNGSGEQGSLLVHTFRASLSILMTMLLVSISAIVMDVVLFFGALKHRRAIVQFWPHGHAMASGAYLVYFWLVLADLLLAGSDLAGYLVLVATILGTVVTVYFWIVVRRYGLKLDRIYLSTVPGSWGHSSTNGYDPASSHSSASSDTGKPLSVRHCSSPIYTRIP